MGIAICFLITEVGKSKHATVITVLMHASNDFLRRNHWSATPVLHHNLQSSVGESYMYENGDHRQWVTGHITVNIFYQIIRILNG